MVDDYDEGFRAQPIVQLLEDGSMASTQRTANRTEFKDYVPADGDWVKYSFLIGSGSYDFTDLGVSNIDDTATGEDLRYWSSAQGKFTDTRLGGNIGVNSRPQFTRYSDIRNKGIVKSRNDVSVTNTDGNHGMGRYYSEAIDDPAQRIYIRFGTPKFLGMASFLASAFNRSDMSLVKTGRFSIASAAGELIGTAIKYLAFPVIALAIKAYEAVSYFIGDRTGRYCSLDPNMHTYWNAVQTLSEHWLVTSGVTPWVGKESPKMGDVAEVSPEMKQRLQELMPDIFCGGNIDIFAVANRAQRIANRAIFNLYQDNDDVEQALKKQRLYIQDQLRAPESSVKKNLAELHTKIQSYFQKTDREMILSERSATLKLKVEEDQTHSNTVDFTEADHPPLPGQKTWEMFTSSIFANADMGSDFAIFVVEHTGSVRESFSNGAKESALSSKLNETSAQARNFYYNMSGGNLLDDGPLGKALGVLIGGVTDVVTGALRSVSLGLTDLVTGLAGNGYVDIPKTYDSSSAQLSEGSYSLQLVSPYGNQISLFQNIYLPIFMLMAGALPRSTGRSSYGSPFMCQLFDRGRCQIPYGMITSLSITRGTSNTPFNRKGHALAVDVTFNITDLSSIMHMPIGSSNMFKDTVDLDASMNLYDYLQVLGGRDMYSQIYPSMRAFYNSRIFSRKMQRYFWSSYWASNINDKFGWLIGLPNILSPGNALSK